MLLTLFNVMDTVGRFLPGRFELCRRGSLLALAASRLATVPLFLGCAYHWAPGMSDALAFITMVSQPALCIPRS